MQHVEPLAGRDSDAGPLSDGHRADARMGPDHRTVGPLDRPRHERLGCALADELAVIPGGEADVHALGLRRGRKSEASRDRPRLGFVVELTDRELDPRELALAEHVERIGLVLRRIPRAEKVMATAGGGDASVVACRESISADLPHAVAHQRVDPHVRIDDRGAQGADRGKHAALVLLVDRANRPGHVGDADGEGLASRTPAGEASQRGRGFGGNLTPRGDHARSRDDSAFQIHFDLHAVAVARVRVASDPAAQTATAAASRSRATTRVSASTNRSTSASVVERPAVTRSDPFATPRATPSARRTWEGSVSPEVHADPLDTAKPSRSSATISDSPSVPGTQNDALFGRRSVGCPFSTASGTPVRTPAIRRSRSFACRGDSVARRSRAMRIATPRPTMPATFSVPVRRPFSCPPPVWMVAMRVPRRTYSAPTPFGP